MITNPATLPPEIQATCDDVMVAIRTPNLIYRLAAMRRRLPAKGGSTLRMPKIFGHLKFSLIDLEAEA